MNTLTEHDRKLAETLRSLTLQPPAEVLKPDRKPIRWIVGVLLVAAIPAIVTLVPPSSLSGIETTHPGQPEPAELGLATAHQVTADSARRSPTSRPSQPSAREITGSGYVVAPRSTTVFSRYEGQITTVAVDVGDQVPAGQPLVILEDANARLVLEQAKAAKVSGDLEVAAREITFAQDTAAFRRAEALAQRDATSEKELEEAETTWKNARNSVEQGRQDVVRAELTIRVAQEQVDELTVRAPLAGTVTALNARRGDTVLARADSVRESQSLLTLTDTTSMVIDADIAETNVSLLRPGLVGVATLDGFPDQPFRVELQRIAPIASAEKGTIGLRLSLFDPPPGMRPSMAARIRIAIPQTQEQVGEAKP
jgi:RND family efflux transporter MFP subunit